MKMKTVSLLAGVAVPLILAGSSSGAFLGLKTFKKFVDPADIAADTNSGVEGITNLIVVNVYAVFSVGDTNASIGAGGGTKGLGGIPLIVNTRDGIFFQHAAGAPSHLPPSSFLNGLPTFELLKHDSFVTIGRKLDDDPVFGEHELLIVGLDLWTDTRLTGSDEVAWTIPGTDPEGIPFPWSLAGQGPDNPPNQVLIAQFTVVGTTANPLGPNPGVFGQMFVTGFETNAMGARSAFTRQAFFDNQVPAPGALALLGTAGLLGCRRRRRRS